jgi:hypothetical protein
VIKSRKLKWAEHVERMEKSRGVYNIVLGKLEEKRPRGRPQRRWENNIKTHHQEVGCGGFGLERAGSR